jgi:hypothetical protein
MSRVEFEPMIPVVERAKTFPALNRTAIVIDKCRTWTFGLYLQCKITETVGILNNVLTANIM